MRRLHSFGTYDYEEKSAFSFLPKSTVGQTGNIVLRWRRWVTAQAVDFILIINIVFCFASFVQVSVIPETFGKSNAPAISGYANTLSSCVTKTPVPIWPYRDAPSVVQSMVKWKWLARMIHTQPPNGKQSKVSTFMHAMQPIRNQFIPNSKSIYI